MSDMSELHVTMGFASPMSNVVLWCQGGSSKTQAPFGQLGRSGSRDIPSSTTRAAVHCPRDPVVEMGIRGFCCSTSTKQQISDDFGYCFGGSIIYRSPNFIDPDCVMPLWLSGTKLKPSEVWDCRFGIIWSASYKLHETIPLCGTQFWDHTQMVPILPITWM
jgi:hypothetical protein